MFSLMSGFYKYMFQKDEYFVLILGLDNAGKTVSLLRITSVLSIINVYIYIKSILNFMFPG